MRNEILSGRKDGWSFKIFTNPRGMNYWLEIYNEKGERVDSFGFDSAVEAERFAGFQIDKLRKMGITPIRKSWR